MFLIGIFSSPLPYLIAAFVYLLGFSFGIFSNTQKDQSGEQVSNIINFETIGTQEQEATNAVDFLDFLDEKDQTALVSTTPAIVSPTILLKPPGIFNNFNFMKHPSWNRFNRPPPIFA